VKDFFQGYRRKLQLTDFSPKLNKENEKRIRLDFAMPLTGQPLVGLPDFVSAAMDAVGKLDSGIVTADCSPELEGFTIDAFPTPEAKRRELLITGATLRGFQVARPDGDTAAADDVTRYFHLNVPGRKEIIDWAWENLGATVFCEFVQTQPSLDLAAEDKPNGKSKDAKSKAAGDDDGEDDSYPTQPAANRRAVRTV
jgi:hypothetical protein